MHLLQVRPDLRDSGSPGAMPGDDSRSILGHRGIKLMHNLCNDVLHQLIDADADRILVGVRLLQGCDLTIENGCRHKMPFACGQARGNYRPVAVQINDTYLRSPTGEEVPVAALERRAGHHAGVTDLPPAVDPVCELFEPRPPVAVIKRMAGTHLVDVRRRMEVVAFPEWPSE